MEPSETKKVKLDGFIAGSDIEPKRKADATPEAEQLSKRRKVSADTLTPKSLVSPARTPMM